MQRALPEISRAELSAVVRAVRARPCRDKHLRAAAGAFAAILLIFLHSASVAAWNSSQVPVGAQEENQMLSLRQIAVVSSLAVSSSALAQNAVQWRVEDGGNGHWYRVDIESSGWIAARGRAQLASGDLASFETQPEWDWIRAWVPQVLHGYLIGGIQDPNSASPAAGWKWLTGSQVETSLLVADDSPCGSSPAGIEDMQQDYLHTCCQLTAFGDIEDILGSTCPLPLRSIVEWSADCNNDGIVDYGQCHDGTLPDYNGNNVPDCCESGEACMVGNYPVQWRAEDGGNGHWYELRSAPLSSWSTCKAAAEASGGHLVTLASQAENVFVVASFKGLATRYPWIGLSQAPDASEPSGGWGWITGEALNWTNWSPAEPNGDGSFDADQANLWLVAEPGRPLGTWNDWHTGGPNGYIIEWSADCNSDGIVDFGQIRDGALADTNANNIPDCCESTQGCNPCPADVDGSGAVNGVDLAAILNVWGTSGGKYPGADVNHDGIVNGADLSEVLNGWGACP